MRVWLAVFVAALLLQAQAPTPGMIISGRIVSAETGRPIPGAQAGAMIADYGLTGKVNSDGHFDIAVREPGQVRVSASAPGYLSRLFGDEPEIGFTPVAVKAGQHVTGIDIALHRGATIAGIVTDDHNEPFVAASVRAFVARVRYGVTRWESAGEARTDDRGRYRLIGLAPGQYAIGAIDRTAITFAPSAAAPGTSPAVTVTADASRENVNVRLRSLKSGSIDSTIAGPGMLSPSIAVQLIPDPIVAILPAVTARVQPGGRFSFADVPAGRYHLVVRPGPNAGSNVEPRNWGIAPVVVTADATAQATITIAAEPRISGSVQAAGVREITIRLSPIGDDHPAASSQSLRVPAQGPFVISAVPPGRYKFEVVLGQGSFLPDTRIPRLEEPATHRLISTVTIKGEDVTDRVLVVSPGTSIDDVRVTVTETAARISGTVVDAAGRPVTAGAVVLAPADARDWTPVSRRIRMTRADTDGVFHLPLLPAGRYRVAHVASLKSGQLWDPAFLKSLSGAREVTVAAGQISTVELRLK